MGLGENRASKRRGERDCAGDDACGRAFPDPGENLAGLLARLEDTPAEVQLPDPTSGSMRTVTVGVDQVAVAVRLLSYSPETSALLPLLIATAVDENDLRPLTAQALFVEQSLMDSMAYGMHNAVVCTEDAPFYGELVIDRLALANTYLGTSQLELLETMCAVWPKGVLDDDLRAPMNSSVPALLLSGGDDPITPPSYGDQAATGFETAHHLTNPNQGHGQVGVPCVGGIIASFFESASVDGLDYGCTEDAVAAPFFLSFSGPGP